MGDGGWCIHGVPYGQGWHCAQCSGGQPSNAPGGTTWVQPNPWTEQRIETLLRKLDHIERLLEKLAGIAR